jgi:hypothetical protein
MKYHAIACIRILNVLREGYTGMSRSTLVLDLTFREYYEATTRTPPLNFKRAQLQAVAN